MRVIKKIVISFVCGIMLLVFLMQNDVWVKEQCENMCKHSFGEFTGCSLDGRLTYMNLFFPRLVFSDLSSCSPDGIQWRWKSDTCTISFSWWQLFLSGYGDVHVEFNKMHAYSTYENQSLSIMNHMYALMQKRPFLLPLFMKTVTLNNAKMECEEKITDSYISLLFNSRTKKMGDILKATVSCIDGNVTKEAVKILSHLKGFVHVDFPQQEGLAKAECITKGSFDCPLFLGEEQTGFFSGEWKNGRGQWSAESSLRSWSIGPCVMTKVGNATRFSLSAQAPCSLLCAVCPQLLEGTTCSGIGSFHTVVMLDDRLRIVDGKCCIRNLIINGVVCGSPCISLALRKTLHQWKGSVTCTGNKTPEFHAQVTWDTLCKEVQVFLKNNQVVSLPLEKDWCIEPGEATASFSGNPFINIQTDYNCILSNRSLDEKHVIAGTAVINTTSFESKGSCDELAYQVRGNFKPFLMVKEIQCNDVNGNPLLFFTTKSDSSCTLSGNIQMHFIRDLAQSVFGYSLQSDGKVCVEAQFFPEILLHFTLNDGSIRLPSTYNVIKKMSASCSVDLYNKKIMIRSAHCNLDKGSIECKNGVVAWDAFPGPCFFHIPFILNHCVLTFKKNFFASFSGHAVLDKWDTQPACLKGAFFIDQGYVEDAFFEQQEQGENSYFMPHAKAQLYPLLCDLTIETKSPMRIKTTSFELDAQCNVHIENTLERPRISGKFSSVSGNVFFPYKPLHIIQATLHFTPDHDMYDPALYLTAQNRIKKYTLTMNVAGSLKNNTITFESSPSLTEEQIIGLLLVGSQEESLTTVMPALIMNNIKSFMFSKDHVQSTMEYYVSKLLKPFEYISFVPSFSDQTGRGGLRGALEITMGDRWRAMVQKNFNLSEDTRFELEYLLSDDISLKAVRNERRDIGAEVELRWKF